MPRTSHTLCEAALCLVYAFLPMALPNLCELFLLAVVKSELRASSMPVCKFSSKIRKVQRRASQQNLQMSVLCHVCFRFVRINDINLGGWGGDLVGAVPVGQA